MLIKVIGWTQASKCYSVALLLRLEKYGTTLWAEGWGKKNS